MVSCQDPALNVATWQKRKQVWPEMSSISRQLRYSLASFANRALQACHSLHSCVTHRVCSTCPQGCSAQGRSFAQGNTRHSPLLVQPLSRARHSAHSLQLHYRPEAARISRQASLAGSLRVLPPLIRSGSLLLLLAGVSGGTWCLPIASLPSRSHTPPCRAARAGQPSAAEG